MRKMKIELSFVSSITFRTFSTALVASTLLLSPTSWAGSSCKITLAGNEVSLSKKIRSQVGVYWEFMKREAPLTELLPFLAFEGVVAGDPHLGNASTIPAKLKNSTKRKIMFLNIDFDDAGRAPFVLDFLRLIITSEAINPDIKKRHMVDAYLSGLKGENIAPPEKIDKLLRMPIAKYDSLVAEYVTDKTKGDKFKFKEGKLTPFEHENITRDDVVAALPEYAKILDLGIRPVESGGSSGNLRIWALVETSEGQRTIVELKQYVKSTLTAYGTQTSWNVWLNEVREVFWPNVEPSSYDLVEVGSSGLFWKREKKIPLIDIPYSSSKKENIQFVNDLAIFNANQMGLAHGRQSSADGLRQLIEKDPTAFREALKPLAKKFTKWIVHQ